MKLKRHPGVAAGPAPMAGTAPRGHHFVPRVVKLMSVTALSAWARLSETGPRAERAVPRTMAATTPRRRAGW